MWKEQSRAEVETECKKNKVKLGRLRRANSSYQPSMGQNDLYDFKNFHFAQTSVLCPQVCGFSSLCGFPFSIFSNKKQGKKKKHSYLMDSHLAPLKLTTGLF